MKWKIDLSSMGLGYTCALILLLLLAAHLPFLSADPDLNISFSRGPFTDEGLNTVQVRNWVNHGYLDLSECDNLLKTPLLGFTLAFSFKLFGAGLTVSRLHVLLLLTAALVIVFSDRRHRGFLLIFIILTLWQYQVFHFSHYSMAEMLSSAAALLSVHFLARSSDPQYTPVARRNNAVLAGIFLSLAYYLKIQFIYLVFLIPLTQLMMLLDSKLVRQQVFRQGLVTSATLLVFLLIYFAAWYLPNRDTFDYMMSGQSGELKLTDKIWEYIGFNLMHYFWKGWSKLFSLVYLLCIAAGFHLLRKSPSPRYPVFFFSSLTWFLLETHKLVMVYLPTRYRISLYVSMGLAMSVVIGEILLNGRKGKLKIVPGWMKGLALTGAFVICFINGSDYLASMGRRAHVIRDTNTYLARNLKPQDLALGAWAPTLTWASGSRAKPVWNNFLNYNDPINHFKPRVIISEIDEQDSEQAYKSQGINLVELADSTKMVHIGQWQVGIYWMPSPHPVPPLSGGGSQ